MLCLTKDMLYAGRSELDEEMCLLLLDERTSAKRFIIHSVHPGVMNKCLMLLVMTT